VVGGHPLPTWIRRLDAASAGQGLLLLTTLLVLATLPLLGLHSSDWPAALLVDAAMGAVLALSLLLPWRSWPKSATLFYPAVTLIGLAALGLGLDSLGIAYAGIFVFAFAYVGLLHPPGSAWRLLPLGLVCYVGMADNRALPMLVRMCVVAVVWVLLAEVLSRLAAHSQAVTADLQLALATDTLTGVGSRREFEARMSRLVRGDTVAILDLDHFKAVNDAQGHGAGDEVLRMFGSVLRNSVRPDDFVARYGGEEFVIVLARTPTSQALDVLVRVRAGWRQLHPEITFSSGIACKFDDGWGSRLLSSADAALYSAKAAGRDRDVVAQEA
jgi:diguanylate cyclase (GGDEF)-like protein